MNVYLINAVPELVVYFTVVLLSIFRYHIRKGKLFAISLGVLIFLLIVAVSMEVSGPAIALSTAFGFVSGIVYSSRMGATIGLFDIVLLVLAVLCFVVMVILLIVDPPKNLGLITSYVSPSLYGTPFWA